MSIIEASSVRVQTMADGTLRLVADIEPRHAQAAFALFGSPGTPMALAALKTYQQQEQQPEKAKGGELSKWIALRCQEPAFQLWLSEQFPSQAKHAIGRTPVELAASVVRAVCLVESRAEIDNDEAARARFNNAIRLPWQKHHLAVTA